MKRKAGEIAAAIGARILGDHQVELDGVASIAGASMGDLVFVEQEKYMNEALQSSASAIIAGNFAAQARTPKTLLIAAHPRLAFAEAAKLVCVLNHYSSGIHPSAIVHESADLGEEASVDALAVIQQDVSIGDRTRIGAGSVVGAGATLGQECHIHPNVTIYPGARLGNRVIVHAGAVLGSPGFGYIRNPGTGTQERFPQIGKLEIEDDVEIGANTTIDRGALETTRIGRGTKIDNLVHIGHNCSVGANVVIAAQAGFSGSVTIEANVVIGGQVGVGEHARIEEAVRLGGQAGVLSNKVVRGKGVAFWGTPARPLRGYLRSLAALARLGK
jgi:UDP-3-O-[3-hydroxymyristoyl] glucosamine N-acyltransferase